MYKRQVLRQLCADGLLERRLYADVPPRTEYSVTEFGRTLLPHVQGLIEWGRENFDTIMHNRARLHRDSMKDIEGGKGR